MRACIRPAPLSMYIHNIHAVETSQHRRIAKVAMRYLRKIERYSKTTWGESIDPCMRPMRIYTPATHYTPQRQRYTRNTISYILSDRGRTSSTALSMTMGDARLVISMPHVVVPCPTPYAGFAAVEPSSLQQYPRLRMPSCSCAECELYDHLLLVRLRRISIVQKSLQRCLLRPPTPSNLLRHASSIVCTFSCI